MMNPLSRKEIKEMLRNAEKLPPEEVKKLVTLLQKMPIELSQKEIEAMSGKPGKERYIYSLKRIAEQKVAWTLKDAEGIMTTEISSFISGLIRSMLYLIKNMLKKA